MSIGTYVNELLKDSKLSPNELAEKLGMSYQNLMKLKTDDSALPSIRVVKQIAQFKKKEESKILYDILLSSAEKSYSLEVLDYLSRLACDGYSIRFNIWYNHYREIPRMPYSQTVDYVKDSHKKIYFGGAAFKKRSRNSFTVVDSWDDLKIQCFEQFRSTANIIHSKNAWATIFNDESAFYNTVVNFAFSKLSQYDENVINYVIVTNRRNKNEIEKITRPITTSNVHFIFEYSDIPYSSKYLRPIDLDYLKKLYTFVKDCKDRTYLPQNDKELLKSCNEAYTKLHFSTLKSSELGNELDSHKDNFKKDVTYSDYLYFTNYKHADEIEPELFYDLLDNLQDLTKYYDHYIFSKYQFNT